MSKRNAVILLFFREIRRIPRDHSLLLTLLIAPILYAFFYGSIYIYKFETEVPIAVIDHDQSELTRELVRLLESTPQIKVTRVYSDENMAIHDLNRGNVQAIVRFNSETELRTKQLKGTPVNIWTNASRFLPANDVLMACVQVLQTAGVGVRLQYYKLKGNYSNVALKEANPVRMDYRPLFNKNLAYGDFLIPGLLLLILQQTLLIGLVEGCAGEREQGSIFNWLRISKTSGSTAIVGKGLFYVVLFASYTLFFHWVNMQVLGILYISNLWVLLLFFVLFFLCLIPMGMAIGLLFKREIAGMQVMAFSSYPFFLLSGYSWPKQALPLSLQFVSNLLPTTPMLNAYIKVTQLGASLSNVFPEVVHLSLLALLYLSLALFQIKRVGNKYRILQNI